MLDPRRSLGSVIKLLTPSRDYTQEYNDWLSKIPSHIYAMAFIIKRFYKEEWQGDWRSHFGVDVVNGEPGHELKYDNRKLVGMHLRVGLDSSGRWRMYKLRQDFAAARKIQLEDDITASIVVPGRELSEPLHDRLESFKFVSNCEYCLFQRPDDAVHRGLDKQTERDIADVGNFFCNFEPLDRSAVAQEASNIIELEQYSEPMRQRLEGFLRSDEDYIVSSASPRLIDGKPSKNPRYLQDRPDLVHPQDRYVAFRGIQLFRGVGSNAPVPLPVSAILSGRRNNPPDRAAGIRSLALYNPIHYHELPELMMDYVCSLTGKSPSTTGAGSEGALTKGPFNALAMVHDLNATLVSMATGKWDGKTAQDPGFRQMFTRESVLQSDWYKARLVAKQEVDIRLAKRKLASLEAYCQQANHQQVIDRLQLTERLKQARLDLDRYESAEYLQSLRGCIGVDPAL